MHFIAFSCKKWKPDSPGRYGINSSASKTSFVTAMFAHMLRLIIQNRFHLLLQYFFQVGVLGPEDFSVCQIFPCEDWQFGVLVLAVLFVWEMFWDSPIVNIVLQTMKRQLLVNTLVNWWEFEISLPGDVKLLYDVMADSEFAARWDPHVVHALSARFARDEIINSLRSALREEIF